MVGKQESKLREGTLQKTMEVQGETEGVKTLIAHRKYV
jgi:hypothetical protein